MEQVKKVNVKRGTGRLLSKVFGVSVESISKAVQGKTNSTLAKRIRIAAVNMGGDPIYGYVSDPVVHPNRVLAEKFRCTMQTVRNSKRGRTNSALAQRIRMAAVNMGGDPIY